MRKFFTLLLILALAPVIAGLYGILHDQITFTISPEYFTRFKFIQFHIPPQLHNRLGVAVIGWNATWWMGVPIGMILGFAGLIHSNWRMMLNATMKAFAITVAIVFVTGLFGLFYGEIFLARKPPEYFQNWLIPENLVDFGNFVSVGSMHNFSYFGGLIGLIAGMIYSIRQRMKFLIGRRREKFLFHR